MIANKPTRTHALRWLAKNLSQWPVADEVTQAIADKHFGNISADLFHGWRFIKTDHGMVFADCISPCITEQDWRTHREFLIAARIASFVIGCAVGCTLFGVLF